MSRNSRNSISLRSSSEDAYLVTDMFFRREISSIERDYTSRQIKSYIPKIYSSLNFRGRYLRYDQVRFLIKHKLSKRNDLLGAYVFCADNEASLNDDISQTSREMSRCVRKIVESGYPINRMSDNSSPILGILENTMFDQSICQYMLRRIRKGNLSHNLRKRLVYTCIQYRPFLLSYLVRKKYPGFEKPRAGWLMYAVQVNSGFSAQYLITLPVIQKEIRDVQNMHGVYILIMRNGDSVSMRGRGLPSDIKKFLRDRSRMTVGLVGLRKGLPPGVDSHIKKFL